VADIKRFSEAVEQAKVPKRKLRPAEITQKVVYTLIDGTVLEGVFIIRLPSLGDDLKIAQTRARLLDGVPWASLPLADQVLIDSFATCEVMFYDVDRTRAPEWWYSRGVDCLESELIIGLATKCKEHAERYFRGSAGQGGSEKAGSRLVFLPVDGAGDGAAG
jgi:hypothetical protein